MKNAFLQHTLLTIKYRFDKSIARSKEGFGEFTLGKGSRTPIEIINHMHQVLYFTRELLEDQRTDPEESKNLDLVGEIERFNNELIEIGRLLDSNELHSNFSKKVLQGPFSDILTHIGQISMLQRLHGNPIEGEDFSAATI